MDLHNFRHLPWRHTDNYVDQRSVPYVSRIPVAVGFTTGLLYKMHGGHSPQQPPSLTTAASLFLRPGMVVVPWSLSMVHR